MSPARTLEVIKGNLPRRALALVLEWAIQHRTELMKNWNLCQSKQSPKRIELLDAVADFWHHDAF
jgi:hypothetical protein